MSNFTFDGRVADVLSFVVSEPVIFVDSEPSEKSPLVRNPPKHDEQTIIKDRMSVKITNFFIPPDVQPDFMVLNKPPRTYPPMCHSVLYTNYNAFILFCYVRRIIKK